MIVGTGLYYLRNINSTGAEGAGWPKFTGGWMFGVPTVGDADGDGNLEVAALTREGNSFLWDTDRPACGGQRRVVDLTPRRVVHRRLRHGQPPARHADPAQRDPQRPARRRSRSRRPATTGCAARRAATGSSRSTGAIDHPDRRRGGGRLRRRRHLRPDRDAHSRRDRPEDDAGGGALPGRRGQLGPARFGRGAGARRSASCSAAGTRAASFSATSGNVKRASRFFLWFPATVTVA